MRAGCQRRFSGHHAHGVSAQHRGLRRLLGARRRRHTDRRGQHQPGAARLPSAALGVQGLRPVPVGPAARHPRPRLLQGKALVPLRSLHESGDARAARQVRAYRRSMVGGPRLQQQRIRGDALREQRVPVHQLLRRGGWLKQDANGLRRIASATESKARFHQPRRGRRGVLSTAAWLVIPGRTKNADAVASASGLARPEGFEPPTPKFVAWCSIQLSYGRKMQKRNCA